jgi:hypothetical protein
MATKCVVKSHLRQQRAHRLIGRRLDWRWLAGAQSLLDQVVLALAERVSGPKRASLRHQVDRGCAPAGLQRSNKTEEGFNCSCCNNLCVVGYDVSLSRRGGTQPTRLLSFPFVLSRRSPTSAVPSSPSPGAAVLARHTCPNLRCLRYISQLSITDFERRPLVGDRL